MPPHMENPPHTVSPKGSRWRVAVVDDHSFIRAIFKIMIEDDPGMELIWSASCLSEARQLVDKDAPDLLILDISLPDGTGFELAREILSRLPDLKILIVSSHKTKADATKARGSGAKGFLPKSSSPEDIFEAIDVVCKGGTYFRL